MPSRGARFTFRRCKAKKATQFKRGWSKNLTCTKESTGNPDAESTGTAEPPVEPMTLQEAKDVEVLCGASTGEDPGSRRLPYKLRPRPEKDGFVTGNDDLSENIIINIGHMSEFLTHMHGTTCEHPEIVVKIEKRIGLCIYMSLKCGYCGYKFPVLPMSDTVEQLKGPPGGALNRMAVLPVLKSKVGLEYVVTVLTCLNIKAPSKTTLQRKLNSMAKSAVELNEEQMIENQEYVARVLSLTGTGPAADVQFDVAYTCRPQGGCEKAAQSFGAMIEHSTSRKLPIAIATANKHCKKKGCKHMDCTKNFGSDASIASSERVLLHRSLKRVDQDGRLKINSITTDSGTQSSKAIRDYYTGRRRQAAIHYKCLVHKLRNLEKHLKQLRLRSIPRKYDKQAYLRKMASSIRGRVRLELFNIRKHTKSDEEFLQSANAAIGNITQCFSGKHGQCRKVSQVCTSHLHLQYNHLPYGEPLKLDDGDMKLIQMKILQMFGGNGLTEVSKLYNTNKCESMNAAVFNYAPKATCWTRNFSGLCHSATHSKTVGPGLATVQLAKTAGINVKKTSAMFIQLKAKDRIRHYHRLRQASAKYKQARHYHRKRTMNRALFKDSVYSSDNTASASTSDHNYGLTF